PPPPPPPPSPTRRSSDISAQRSPGPPAPIVVVSGRSHEGEATLALGAHDPAGRFSARRILDRGTDAVEASGRTQAVDAIQQPPRSEEHTSELQSRGHLVC